MEKIERDYLEAFDIMISLFDRSMKAKHNQIYYTTTENIRAYSKHFNGDYHKALLPTSSGDHVLEAILSGIDDITCYDINKLTKYFVELKLAAFKTLYKEDYIKYFYDERSVLSKDIYEEIKPSLGEFSKFWDFLYEKRCSSFIYENLFRNVVAHVNGESLYGMNFDIYSSNNYTSYMKDDNYKLIQSRLDDIAIKYFDCDLVRLGNSLGDEKFDLINLSNIYDFINIDITKEGAKTFVTAVKQLIPHLNDDGKMLIAYIYQCCVDDLKNTSYMDSILINNIINKFEKSNFGIFLDMCRKDKNKNSNDKILQSSRIHYLISTLRENIELYELPQTYVGMIPGIDTTDMAIVYTKK